jgi:hypothetical protein
MMGGGDSFSEGSLLGPSSGGKAANPPNARAKTVDGPQAEGKAANRSRIEDKFADPANAGAKTVDQPNAGAKAAEQKSRHPSAKLHALNKGSQLGPQLERTPLSFPLPAAELRRMGCASLLGPGADTSRLGQSNAEAAKRSGAVEEIDWALAADIGAAVSAGASIGEMLGDCLKAQNHAEELQDAPQGCKSGPVDAEQGFQASLVASDSGCQKPEYRESADERIDKAMHETNGTQKHTARHETQGLQKQEAVHAVREYLQQEASHALRDTHMHEAVHAVRECLQQEASHALRDTHMHETVHAVRESLQQEASHALQGTQAHEATAASSQSCLKDIINALPMASINHKPTGSLPQHSLASAGLPHHSLRVQRVCHAQTPGHVQCKLARSGSHSIQSTALLSQIPPPCVAAHVVSSPEWPQPPTTFQCLRPSPRHRCWSLAPHPSMQCSTTFTACENVVADPSLQSQLQRITWEAGTQHKDAQTSMFMGHKARTLTTASLGGPHTTAVPRRPYSMKLRLHVDGSASSACHFSPRRSASLPRRWQSMPVAGLAQNPRGHRPGHGTSDKGRHHTTIPGEKMSSALERAGRRGLPEVSNEKSHMTAHVQDLRCKGREEDGVYKGLCANQHVSNISRSKNAGTTDCTGPSLSLDSPLAVPLFHVVPRTPEGTDMNTYCDDRFHGAMAQPGCRLGQTKATEERRAHRGSTDHFLSSCSTSRKRVLDSQEPETGGLAGFTGGAGLKSKGRDAKPMLEGDQHISTGRLVEFGSGSEGMVWVPSPVACQVFAASLQQMTSITREMWSTPDD